MGGGNKREMEINEGMERRGKKNGNKMEMVTRKEERERKKRRGDPRERERERERGKIKLMSGGKIRSCHKEFSPPLFFPSLSSLSFPLSVLTCLNVCGAL